MQRRARAYGPYKHGKIWRVHFVAGSRGDRKTTYETFASEDDAQRCVDAANTEAQGITVTAAITAYLDYKRGQGRAESTIVTYERRLRALLGAYASRQVRAVLRRGADLYAAAVGKMSPDGHQNLLVAGQLWARWCVKQRLLAADPFTGVEPVGQRRHGGDKDRLTIDESRKLEAWCLAHPSDRGAIVTLAYLYLGVRNSELCRRVVRDLDDGGRLLWIGRTKTAAGRRKLRIPAELGAMLVASAAGAAPDAPLFPGLDGERLSVHSARRLTLATCNAAGVPELSPQALRRTHSALATEAGETGYAVARALGHATGATPAVTTRSYVGSESVAVRQGDTVLRVLRSVA